MRLLLLPLIFVALLSFMPAPVEASFFGPIVPPECNCEDEELLGSGMQIATAADWGCVMQTVQNVMNFAVSISVIIIIISIVYAGVMFMTSAASPSGREAGRKMVTNAFIGLVVVLSAWLLVDFLMKVLYDPEGDANFGPWQEILAPGGAPRCIQAVGPAAPPTFGVNFGPGRGPDVVPGGGGGGDVNVPLGSGTGACNPALVKQGAAAGGQALSNAEANTFACIARFESTCGTRVYNYRWNRGTPGNPGSTAVGPFQVLLSSNHEAYENRACYQAAGVSGPLNCNTGFRNGNPIPNSAVVARCVRAAANLNCSATAAAYVLRQQGFRAWIADRNSAKQRECIDRGR